MTVLQRSWTDSRPDDWSPDWCPPPTFGTRRRPERPTYGGHAAEVAKRLGTPYMPFQRHIADVACEFDPDTGLFYYSTVIIIIPRQSGKTTVIVLSLTTMRGMMWPKQAIVFTAQDRNHARDKFFDDFVPRLELAPGLIEGRDFEIRKSNGSERITFSNGSYIYISATGAQSGHSKTLDMPVVDEAWYHSTTDIDTGFRVPMITRKRIVPGAQQLIVSAGGEEGRSFYLAGKKEMGRKAVAADRGRGVAYFEYSCPPDHDPRDPANWWYWIPSLGHMIQEDDIADELEAMSDFDEWLRAYGSIDKPLSSAGECGVNLEHWSRQAVDSPREYDGDLVVGVAQPDEGSHASLAVAGWCDGDLQAELVDHRPGTDWLEGRLVELWEKWPDIAGVAIDSTGTAAWLLEELRKREIEVFPVSQGRYANFCKGLVERLEAGSVGICRNEDLDRAVEASARRSVGDRWVWDRRVKDADVSPLEAVTLAASGVSTFVDEEVSSAYGGDGFDEDW